MRRGGRGVQAEVAVERSAGDWRRRVDGGRLLRAALLAGTGLVIVKLLLTGQMVKYMAPSLDPLTLAAGVIMLVLAAVELWLALRGGADAAHDDGHDHAHDDGHDHGHGRGGELALTALLLGGTIALGLLFAPRALGTAAMGGEDLAGYLLAFDPAAARPAVAPPPRPLDDVPELMAYLQRAGEAAVGQPVSLVGLVAPSGGLQGGEFALLRYRIVHCVADARPIGLLVAHGGAMPPQQQWVRIEGVIAVRERQGSRLLTIEASQVTPVPEPENPYV